MSASKRKQIESARLQKAEGSQTAEVRGEKKQKAESRSMSVATKRQFEQPDFRRQSAGAEVRRQQ